MRFAIILAAVLVGAEIEQLTCALMGTKPGTELESWGVGLIILMILYGVMDGVEWIKQASK